MGHGQRVHQGRGVNGVVGDRRGMDGVGGVGERSGHMGRVVSDVGEGGGVHQGSGVVDGVVSGVDHRGSAVGSGDGVLQERLVGALDTLVLDVGVVLGGGGEVGPWGGSGSVTCLYSST